MFGKVILILIFFSISFYSLSDKHIQLSNSDSLARKLSVTNSTKEQIELLNTLCDTLIVLSDYNKAKTYISKLLQLAKEIPDRKQEANAYRYMGNLFYSQSKYSQAIKYLNKALAIYTAIDDQLNRYKTIDVLGDIFIDIGDYTQALSYHRQVYTYYKKTENKESMPASLYSIGNLYSCLDNDSLAIHYFKTSLSICKQYDNKSGIAAGLNNIGVIYMRQKKYSAARKNMEQALDYWKAIGDKEKIAGTLLNIGSIYAYTKKYKKTLDYYHQSLAISRQINNNLIIAKTLYNIGSTYILTNSYNKAIEFLNQALEVAAKENIRPQLADIYEKLFIAYNNLNDSDQALKYNILYNAQKDTLYSQEKTNAIVRMETRHELETKEKKIEMLKQKQEIAILQRYLFILGALFVLVISCIVIHKQRKKIKTAREEIEYKNGELKYMALKIIQKKEFIEDLRNKVKSADKNIPETTEIKKMIEYDLNIDKDKKEFQLYVDEQNKSFLYELSKCFPELSKNEKRLCTLIKLGLSSNEIATLTNVGIRAVEKSRARLRKKLNIDTTVNLTEYINQI